MKLLMYLPVHLAGAWLAPDGAETSRTVRRPHVHGLGGRYEINLAHPGRRIVGGSLSTQVPRNEFLTTTRSFGDFVLRVKFKLVGTEGFINGGVQIRSQRLKGRPTRCPAIRPISETGTGAACTTNHAATRRWWRLPRGDQRDPEPRPLERPPSAPKARPSVSRSTDVRRSTTRRGCQDSPGWIDRSPSSWWRQSGGLVQGHHDSLIANR